MTPITLAPHDWLWLCLHFLGLSLLSVGGAITTVADMHRYLVDQQTWLTDAQFTSAIALAQAAPGPNILFVALLGWQIGSNAGGPLWGLLGALFTLGSILLPSTTLTYYTASWLQRHSHSLAVRAFKQGLTPVVIGLLIATGCVIATAHNELQTDWPYWGITAISAGLVWRTRLPMLGLLIAGALISMALTMSI
ncbi:chromate transporter [Parvibium lacunae]|uniref:Chromate transporter n=1 Tax=Parvibium lacunae TaxID=1888893 RepID=A0A368L564_9BURK|nr:chromate transporter [Parvibium lacunae]RCS58698.1 chromate transporter [Parvibium lacunae]